VVCLGIPSQAAVGLGEEPRDSFFSRTLLPQTEKRSGKRLFSLCLEGLFFFFLLRCTFLRRTGWAFFPTRRILSLFPEQLGGA